MDAWRCQLRSEQASLTTPFIVCDSAGRITFVFVFTHSVHLLRTIMGNQPSASRIPTPTNYTFDEKDTFLEVSETLSSLHITEPLSSDGTLTLGHVASWESTASADTKVQLARTILSQVDIRKVLSSRSAKISDQHIFNNALDFKTGPITNQKSSGRCWLFATTNVIRYNIMKRLKLKEFQLSQVSSNRFRRSAGISISVSL